MANGRLIVTGHNGFVGARLCEIAELKGFELLTVEGDLLDIRNVEMLLNDVSDNDVLIHLAGSFFGDEPLIIQKNLILSTIISKAISKRNIKVIFTSSGAVYGNSGADPISENFSLNPNTIYGLVKKWSEEIFKLYVKNPSKNLTIFRIPSLYGPNNRLGVISLWGKSIKENKSIILHGDGHQERSFLHVDDLCNAILLNASSNISGIFNVSEKNSYNLSEILDIFQSHSSFDTVRVPLENELHSMVLNSNLFRSTAQWEPSFELEKYIKFIFDQV